MSKLITIDCEDSIETHIAGNFTDHVSFCGIDGYDTDQTIIKTIGKKVDCEACVELWKIARNIPKELIEIDNA